MVGGGGWGRESRREGGGNGGGGRRQKSQDAEMKMENFIFFSLSPENMMNGDMRKAHYVHDDEKKMLLVVLKE